MVESKFERILRMLIHSESQPRNIKFIKSYLKKTKKSKLELLIVDFKLFYAYFLKEKQEDLMCEAAADKFFINSHYLKKYFNICKWCGAVIQDFAINVKPHVCWDLLEFNKYQLIYECCALMLEKQKISLEEIKFIIWSLNENGEYKLEV